MNYYIDFDHTLFDTPTLTKRMLQAIVDSSHMDLAEECKSLFNREHIYNIYELVDFLSDKYNLNRIDLISAINLQVNNCKDLVYEDGLNFIKKIKDLGNKIYLLSYYEHGLQYQISKITGSKISNLFDGIIVCGESKYNLDIDYKNSIFIDDKPQDLIGLHSKNPYKLIRIRRENHKYSDKNLDFKIDEYKSFSEIKLN